MLSIIQVKWTAVIPAACKIINIYSIVTVNGHCCCVTVRHCLLLQAWMTNIEYSIFMKMFECSE